MIKQLKKFDVQTTPFTATKTWNLLNVQQQDLLLLDIPGTSGETYLALEFLDYDIGVSYGTLNTSCDIALEQQTADPVIYEEGISGSGLFYPNDPQNLTGTYKRLIYHQILRAFYNTYRNPLEIFGLENIDFGKSGTLRYLDKQFKVFSLPKEQFGDKIVEGTVTFVDNAFDDNYTVNDDSQGNLFASQNLFSKVQELWVHGNVYVTGTMVHTCPVNVVSVPISPTNLTASALSPSSSYLNWIDNSNDELGFYIYRSDDAGVTWFYLSSTATDISWSYDTTLQQTSSYSYKVQAYNAIGTSSFTNTASITTPAIIYIPPVPLTLTVTSGSSLLLWATASTGVYEMQTSFSVQRSTDGITYANYDSVTGSITNYTDSVVLADTKYWYQVAAWNSAGTSSYSNTASIKFAPTPPGSLTVISGSSVLNWLSSSTQDSFSIQRSTDGMNYSNYANVSGTILTYTDTSVSAGLTYWYQVAALNDVATSSFTAPASITFAPLAPSAGVSSGSAQVFWVTGSQGATSFSIQKRFSADPFDYLTNVAGNVLNYTDSAVRAGEAYGYRVSAYNAGGSSSFSGDVNILFAPTPPYNLAATSGSSVLTWQSSSTCISFSIMKSIDDGVSFDYLTNVGASSLTYTDTDVIGGATYSYKIAAYNTAGSSSFSPTASITFTTGSIPLPAYCTIPPFQSYQITGSIATPVIL